MTYFPCHYCHFRVRAIGKYFRPEETVILIRGELFFSQCGVYFSPKQITADWSRKRDLINSLDIPLREEMRTGQRDPQVIYENHPPRFHLAS